MDIIDAHCHIKCDNDFQSNLFKLKTSMIKNGIKKSILFIDPFVDEFKCPNSSLENFHYCHVTDKLDLIDNLSIMCDTCSKIIYNGEDPFNVYNRKLFDALDDSSFYLFLTLSLSNKTINRNINEFHYLYGEKLKGLKLYTGLSDLVLNDLIELKSDLPLIIHTGKAYNQNPENMIEFLKKYKGYVILAHYARFCPHIVDIIKNYDNIYVDTSPSYYIYNNYINRDKKCGLFDYANISQPEDLYYKAIDLYGIDKVIFGSDYPFSNLSDEISLLNNLKLSDDEYKKIAYKNLMKVLK